VFAFDDPGSEGFAAGFDRDRFGRKKAGMRCPAFFSVGRLLKPLFSAGPLSRSAEKMHVL
jgi:hypothetical protein